MQTNELIILFEGVRIDDMSLLNRDEIKKDKSDLTKLANNGLHQACQKNAPRSESGGSTG